MVFCATLQSICFHGHLLCVICHIIAMCVDMDRIALKKLHITIKYAFCLAVYFLFYLFIQYFKRVAHLAVQLFYLAALCANIFTYIQTL